MNTNANDEETGDKEVPMGTTGAFSVGGSGEAGRGAKSPKKGRGLGRNQSKEPTPTAGSTAGGGAAAKGLKNPKKGRGLRRDKSKEPTSTGTVGTSADMREPPKSAKLAASRGEDTEVSTAPTAVATRGETNSTNEGRENQGGAPPAAVRISDRGQAKLAKLRGDTLPPPSQDQAASSEPFVGVPGVFSNENEIPDQSLAAPTESMSPVPGGEATSNQDFLVEATLVAEASQRGANFRDHELAEGVATEENAATVVEAREVGFSDHFRDWKMQCLCILLLVIFGAIVGVAVMATNRSAGTDLAESKPIVLIPGIESYTIEALQDPTTPQTSALHWVNNHPDFSEMMTERKQQLFALATFAYETMASPLDWLDTSLPECVWGEEDLAVILGQKSSDRCNDGLLSKLEFPGSRLKGTIPPQMAFLSSLTSLEFGNNFMDGVIPTTLGVLTSMKLLSLHSNAFSGGVPTELGQMTDLNWLLLHTNLVSGPLPTEIAQLTKLVSLHIYDTDLTGESIEDTLNTFPFLDSQSFGGKATPAPTVAPAPTSSMSPTTTRATATMGELLRVLGDIVAEPGTPHEMALDWLLNNDPMQLDEFSENLIQRYTLALFYFQTSEDRSWRSCNPPVGGEDSTCAWYEMNSNGDNSVYFAPSDTLETRWLSEKHECKWAKVTCLPEEDGSVVGIDIIGQNLTGTLPDELIFLSVLTNFSVSYNTFTGTIPASYGEFGNLQTFECSENLLTGPLQGGFLKQESLLVLNLAHNLLTGTLPPEIGLLTNLQSLVLDGSELTGSLPSEIGSMSAMRTIWMLDNNGLAGEIPSEIGKLSLLEDLKLSNNGHSGPLPSEMGALTKLKELWISGSNMGGTTIPDEFWNMESMTILDINAADFGGTISTRIGQMSRLKGFKASKNRFMGTLPSEIGQLDQLQLLWVHINEELGGEIPIEICRLRGPEDLMFLNADCAGSVPRISCQAGCCTGCCDEFGQCQAV